MVKKVLCGVVAFLLIFVCGSCGSPEIYESVSKTTVSESFAQETSADISSDSSIFETTASFAENTVATSILNKATTAIPPTSKRDFTFPDTAVFKLEMDALPKTEYRVGDVLEVTTKLTNTASRGYGLTWGYYLIKVWLERVGDDPLPSITPAGIFFLSAKETIVNHNINGLAVNSESYVFKSAGTYRLTVSATFDVCDFTGTEAEWEKEMGRYLNTDKGKKSYTYSLSPITITVTR